MSNIAFKEDFEIYAVNEAKKKILQVKLSSDVEDERGYSVKKAIALRNPIFRIKTNYVDSHLYVIN